MVLVLWSDPAPVRAVVAAIKRCAYVLIPLSVLFCKYYEDLGRSFDSWGRFSYTGVATDKNMFGYLLFAFGLFFVASLLGGRDPHGREHRPDRADRTDRVICILMLAMIGWLIPIANSKTATVRCRWASPSSWQRNSRPCEGTLVVHAWRRYSRDAFRGTVLRQEHDP